VSAAARWSPSIRDGEVLAFVSKPTFDPNLFVEGIDSESWKALNESIDKPLLNRALRGTYPPGSTYKPFMALAALHSGKRGPERGGTTRASGCSRATASAATATTLGGSTCAAASSQVEQHLLLFAGQRDGR
jgi:cell division protein FtsI/penicillin-binding protein 2